MSLEHFLELIAIASNFCILFLLHLFLFLNLLLIDFFNIAFYKFQASFGHPALYFAIYRANSRNKKAKV